MNKVTRKTVEALVSAEEMPALTIYMPTHPSPTSAHLSEDQIRLKTLLKDAKQQWKTFTQANHEPSFFHDLEDMIQDAPFWDGGSAALAIFASEQRLDIYTLPLECEEHVCVGDSYDLMPLMAVVSYNQPYYLLALALHGTKLFEGDAYGLHPVDIAFPTSPEEALNIDEMYANSNTVRNQNSSSGATMSTGSHGPGDSNQAGHEERLQYFRIIDGMITSSHKIEQSRPILLASTTTDAGDYRNLSHIDTLLEETLTGNVLSSDLPTLHRQAWPLVEHGTTAKQQRSFIEEVMEQKGRQKASLDMDQIEEAAEAGRVGTLLIRAIRHTFDSVRDANKKLPLLSFPPRYEAEALPRLARRVFMQGGHVVGVEEEALDSLSPVAALYRY